MQTLAPERITNVDTAPSYFAKVTADGKYMCYIAGGNIIMNLDTGGQVRIPGPYDPVPAPPTGYDHRVHYVSAVGDGDGSNSGMAIYDFQRVVSRIQGNQTADSGARPLYLDHNNVDDYQSIGVVPGTTNHPVLRMLTAGLTLHEYDTRDGNDSIHVTSKAICGQGRYQLPMISKDGQELAAFDTQDSMTKILKINSDGSCTEELNLGFATGKVEFAYNGRAITFHVDSYNKNLSGIFSGVQYGMVKNVYVLKLDRSGGQLKAGALIPITHNTKPGNGSYYPSFTEDGKVVYVNGQANPDGSQSYSFVTVDPGLFSESNIAATHCANCGPADASNTNKGFTYALGRLWANVCSEVPERMDATDAAFFTLSMDPAACRKLVTDHWDQQKDKVRQDPGIVQTNVMTAENLQNLRMEDLLAACPSAHLPSNHMISQQVSGSALAVRILPAAQTFQTQCRGCHDGTHGPKFDWNHLSLGEVNNMLAMIRSGAMPKDPIPNQAQVLAPLIQGLEQKQQRLQSQ
jgi:hypothetical protein